MKRKFKDIIPPDKRSIRNIPLPARQNGDESIGAGHPSMDGIKPVHTTTHTRSAPVAHARPTKATSEVRDKPKGFTPSPEIEVVDDGHGSYGKFNPNKKHDWRIWIGIAAVLLIGVYFLSSYFARADIIISLTKHNVSLNDTTVPLNKVMYEAVTGDITKTVTVAANGSQKISKYATGTVVIYNSSNTVSQPLAINTRLETPDGHLFKTDKAVTVPAVKTVNGKKTAGSVEVNITADKPGEAYNLGLKDFTLVGFKGTANYENFYARSKTALAGGFVGTVPDIDQTELANTILSLKRSIDDGKKALIADKIKEIVSAAAEAEAVAGVPVVNDYIYIPETSIVEYSNVDTKQSKDGKSADVTISGKVTALVLSNASLSRYIKVAETADNDVDTRSASSTLPERYSGDFSNVTIKLPSGLTAKTLITSANMSSTNLTVTASGTASVFSTVDDKVLSAAVSHLSRDSALSIIKSLVDADTIEVKLKPWWFSTLPSSDNIRVIIEK